jgi:tRNA (guanine-N7-)-methyltransferase
VGKNKLGRWAEMKSFGNVLEPDTSVIKSGNHPVKGNWKRDYFRNDNPVSLELGCGKGEYSVGLAKSFPGRNYVGIDIKGARIWRGAKTAFEEKIPNVFFLRTRIEFINSFFDEDEVDEIWITFPDPFPRPRNESRRLTSPPFLNSYRKFLKNNGVIHLKTDNLPLYNYTCELVKKNGLEILASTEDLYSGEIENEILSIRTHYENIFLKENKKINYLSFLLPKNKPVLYANQGKELQ